MMDSFNFRLDDDSKNIKFIWIKQLQIKFQNF